MSEQVKVAGVWRGVSFRPSEQAIYDGRFITRDRDGYFQTNEWVKIGGGNEGWAQYPENVFEWLDESPLALREASQQDEIDRLTASLASMTRERDFSRKEEAEAEADNVRLEQELAKMKEQRDRLLRGCKLGLDHLLEANDGWYRDKPTVKYMQDAIAACEQGGSNDK